MKWKNHHNNNRNGKWTGTHRKTVTGSVGLLSLLFLLSVCLHPLFVQAAVDLPDGSYEVEVELQGGSGRASVTSPAKLTVQQKQAVAEIEWSSPYYDYMIVDDVTYQPVNTEGNSVFEIPVEQLGEPVSVVADTTAMSVPHEISYTLTFSEPDTGKKSSVYAVAAVLIVSVLACVTAAVTVFVRKKQKPDERMQYGQK